MKNEIKKSQRSPLALAVLALLTEEPMHPYRIQQLIKERGKDEVINVRKRTNIYQTIDRLLRDELIVIRETRKESGKPDRTIYEATEEGRCMLLRWLIEMVSTPAEEYNDFPVAISFLMLLSCEEALQQLESRATVLAQKLHHIDAQLQSVKDSLPRLFILETEYSRAVLQAELQWVNSVMEDIRSGALSWSEEWLREIANQLGSSGENIKKEDLS